MKSDLCAGRGGAGGTLDTYGRSGTPRAALARDSCCGYQTSAPRDVIEGLDHVGALPGKLFHAGTTMKNGKAVSNGGRVLCAVGIGATVKAAQRDAYMIVDAVGFDGAQCRRDIGYRAIERESGNSS